MRTWGLLSGRLRAGSGSGSAPIRVSVACAGVESFAPLIGGFFVPRGYFMADRTVRVVLKATVDEYIKGMNEAAKQTRDAGTAAEQLAQQRGAIQDLGVAAMAMGAVTAAGVGLAVAKWADFDQAMSQVQAATGESEQAMEQLSQAALDAGARTVFSAEEAANAIEELAKAGVSTKDILGGALDGALDLAAAGGLGVAEAAGIAATALKTFNLEGTDMAHVADLLAAGAGKAMGDVTDLSAALNQSAMVASATGLSIEETTAGLAAFASQGLLGSDAGTSFKSMLQSLTPTSGKAADEMERLGISAYDSQGNFVGLAEFAGNLQGALKDLTVEQQQAALKTIFGSDAIRAATVLYSEGEEGIREWTDAVSDQGYAADQAAMRLDNLKGDLEALGGALDTALIKTGSGANEVLREMVQFVTSAIDAYAELPAELQSAALIAGILAAAVGLLGGGFMIATIKVAEFRVALATLGVTGGAVRSSLMGMVRFLTGPWGAAMLAATVATIAFNAVMDGSKASAEDFEIGLKQGASALELMQGAAAKNEGGITKAFVNLEQHFEALPALADKAAESGRGFFSSLSFNENAALDSINALGVALNGMATEDLPSAQEAFKSFVSDSGLNDTQALTLLNEEMVGFKSTLLDTAIASGLATDDATLLKLALGEIGPAAEDGAAGAGAQTDALTELEQKAAETKEAVSALAEQIRGFGAEQFDVERATVSFYDALDGLRANLDSGAASLDVTTAAGRETANELLGAASSTNEYAAAIAAMGGTTEEVDVVLEAGRQRIVETRMALGDSEEAARRYADQLIATPEMVSTSVELLKAQEAEAELNRVAAPRQSFIDVIYREMGAPQWKGTPYKLPDSADGNLFEFANGGGLNTGIYSGGPPITRFAEPETGWEAFISGKPSERDRNRQIWQETGERLGVMSELKAALAGAGRAPGATVNQTIQASPGMSEFEVGRIAADKTVFALGG